MYQLYLRPYVRYGRVYGKRHLFGILPRCAAALNVNEDVERTWLLSLKLLSGTALLGTARTQVHGAAYLNNGVLMCNRNA